MTDIETAFEGELRQFSTQIDRLTGYLSVASQALQDKPDALRVLLDTTVVMTMAFLDHYLRSVVIGGAFMRESAVRRYLAESGNEHERSRAEQCPVKELRQLMIRRVSLLQKNGRRLANTFECLFGFSVWPDDERPGKLVRDLARIRNLIVHGGGFPEKNDYDELETSGPIQQVSAELGFYRMNLTNAGQWLGEALAAAGHFVLRHHLLFQQDERWRYRGPLFQLPDDDPAKTQ